MVEVVLEEIDLECEGTCLGGVGVALVEDFLGAMTCSTSREIENLIYVNSRDVAVRSVALNCLFSSTAD